jgi:hypothetical protein
MSGIARYRALVNCRAGGTFRNAGEEFDMPVLEELPPFLELIESAEGAAKQEKKPAAPATSAATVTSGKQAAKPPASRQAPRNSAPSAGATAKDLGVGGEATSAAAVTSADMVKT